MSHEIPNDLTELKDQPVQYIEEIGGLYFRAICLAEGQSVPQHVHDHPHVTLIAAGKVRMWIDGVWVADIGAFKAVEVEAGRKHLFQALEPMTRIACVHDVASAESVKRKGV